VMNRMAVDSSWGGRHRFFERNGPRLAWSEGAATFFGGLVKHDPLYYNASAANVQMIDLERSYEVYESLVAAASSIRGTSDGTQEGKLSELLVASILWDLDDSASPAEAWDIVSDEPRIVESVFRYLKTRSNRGVLGADLVDFLDGFRCRGFSSKPPLQQVLNFYDFNYDFNGPATCP